MSDELPNAPSDHSDDSFDVVLDDTSSGRLVHVGTPSGMDPIVDKLLEVLSGTTKVLAQNQAVLGNMAQMLEIVFKDKCQNAQWLEALTKNNDARDRRMVELSDELDGKFAAIGSLEKAVKDAHSEVHLLKDCDQEKDRQIAEMSKKIKALEELQAADKRDAALEIDELETLVEDERAKVGSLEELVDAQEEQLGALAQRIKELEELQTAGNRQISELKTVAEDESANVEALEELVNAQDEQLTALSQKVQKLTKLQEKNTYEKDRGRVGSPAQNSAYVSTKSKPFVAIAQHAPFSQSVEEVTTNTKKEPQSSKSKSPQSKLKAFIAKDQADAKLQKAGRSDASHSLSICGQTVSLRAYDGYFLCGNYDNEPATITGIDAKRDSVRFTVENAGNGKVALKSCGNYLTIMEDGSAVNCCRARNKWSHFDWVEHDSGQVSLCGANGKYVSSESGGWYGEYVTCNRGEAGPLERFTVV